MQLDKIRKSIRRFDYAHAIAELAEILAHPLPKAFRDRLIEARQICQAFDLWDKFAHTMALELLSLHGARFPEHFQSLKCTLGGMRNSSGYEKVGDLLNNADRKAHRGYYDDAVARLYRATELFAQIRMAKQFGYRSDGLKLTDLPENLQAKYRERARGENKLL
jgi:hypothetical protein